MISDNPVFYITPDPLKAVGLAGIFDDFHVVCYDDKPLVDQLNQEGTKTISLEREIGSSMDFIRNAGKMLEEPDVIRFIETESHGKTPAILFFKPSFKIDIICRKRGYIKLGNDADLNRSFEDKLEFFKLCQKMGWPTPNGMVGKISEFDYDAVVKKVGSPFVIQFGRGWAGSTTFFIATEYEWGELKQKWPEKEVKISRKINGFTVLNNACCTKNDVLVSYPAIQLPPIKGMSENASSTFGRQWPSGLNNDQIAKIGKLTKEVGMLMGKSGYKGWFGLDFLVEEDNGEIFISENNARLTASATFYTQAELESGIKKPMMYYHVIQFTQANEIPKWKPIDIVSSQFVFRNFEKRTLTIKRSLKSGVYDRSLNYIRMGSGIFDLKSKDEIFVYAPVNGEKINQDIELFTLESKGSFLNEKIVYENWFYDIFSKITKAIEFI